MANPTGAVNAPNERIGVVEKGTDDKESRILIGAPDYRVFIFGVEVTSDVFSISVTQTYNERIGTAIINIANDNEKWNLPTSFSAVERGFTADELSVGDELSGSHGLIDTPGALRGTNTKTGKEASGPVEKDGTVVTPFVFAREKKNNMRIRISGLPEGEAREALSIRFQNQPSFPFIPGQPLIQMADPIRVFIKNPWNLQTSFRPDQVNTGEERVNDNTTFNPNVEDLNEQWYFGFTGFIASVTEDFDAETNRSILRLFCEDIRRILRYARITSNPQAFRLNSIRRETVGNGPDIAGIVQPDIYRYTANQAVSANQTLVDLENNTGGIVEQMLFNTFPQDPETSQNPPKEGYSDGQVPKGVLGFRRASNPFAAVSAGGTIVQPSASSVEQETSDLMEALYPTLTPDEVTTFGLDWSLGALDNINRLFILVPSRANFPDRKFPYDFQARVSFFYEWKSRFEVINEFVKAQDSVWYSTPKGDIVVEFPQYDALPQRYEVPWTNVLTIQDEFTGFNATQDDRLIQTQTIVQASPIDGLNVSAQLPFGGVGSKENPELIGRYGLRLHMEGRPFKYSADDVESADQLAAMWQELTNADAYRLEGLTTTPNFRAPIARPYYFKFRNIIGFATQITHTIVWGQLARTEYGLQYIRNFDPVDGVWKRVGGNYAWNWRGDSLDSGAIPPSDVAAAGVSRAATTTSDAFRRAEQQQTISALQQARSQIETTEVRQARNILTDADRQELDEITVFLKSQSPSDLESATSTSVRVRQQRINRYLSILKARVSDAERVK